VLSRVNTLEEGKGGPKNDTEERAKIESALTSLHQRISELEKGKGSGERAACSPETACLGPAPCPGLLSRPHSVIPPQLGLPAQFLGWRYLSRDAAELKKGLYSTVRTLAGFFLSLICLISSNFAQ
jgi:hypothetical protein